jgi:hypothetical protein
MVHNVYRSHLYLKDKLNTLQRIYFEKWCDDSEFKTAAATDDDIYNALEKFSRYLFDYSSRRVLVLVDEYDAVCTDAFISVDNEKELKKIIALCTGTLSCLMKGNKNVSRGIMTGISYLLTIGLSKLNNVRSYRFQENNVFFKYFGLTTEELRELLHRFNRDADFEKLMLHYNGYRNNMISTWSIINYLNEKSVDNYWKSSSLVYNLDKTLKITVTRSILNKLLSNICNEVEIKYFRSINFKNLADLKTELDGNDITLENVDLFLNFLVEQGYFRIVNFNLEEEKIKIKIPNLEIKQEFYEQLTRFYVSSYKLDLSLVRLCGSKFNALNISDENNKKVLAEIVDLMNKTMNTIRFNLKNEAELHHLTFLMIYFSKFKCYTNDRSAQDAQNEFDLLMLKNNVGIIIEDKIHKGAEKSLLKAAEKGLKQILEKKYYKAFKNDFYNPEKIKVDYYILIGVAMSARSQKIALSVLFNNLDYKNKTAFYM